MEEEFSKVKMRFMKEFGPTTFAIKRK